MNRVTIESSIGLDDLATWDQVRRSMSVSFEGVFGPVPTEEKP